MKVIVKGGIKDIIAFGKHIKQRDRIFQSTSAKKKPEGIINRLARDLHPESQQLVVDRIVNESPMVKTFRLKPVGKSLIAPFRAGQYVALSFEHQGLTASRPYSISSSPSEALQQNYYDITIKKAVNQAFFSEIAFGYWEEGTKITASGPNGSFYFEPLRDAKTLICIAGGSGVTPFRSIIKEELQKHPGLNIHLFYGFNSEKEELFQKDFQEITTEYSKRFSYTPVAMEASGTWTGETGTITEDLIRKSLKDEDLQGASLFLCGPKGLHSHMEEELSSLKETIKQIRRENFGAAPAKIDNPSVYKLTVIQRGTEKIIEAIEGESLVTALERAGLNPPAWCRSGDCGWCRSQLVEGEIETDDGLTGIRGADKKFNWIHPCVSFPKSDITLRVPKKPDSKKEE